MSKVVKYTCSLRRYNYTHDHIDILLSVFRNFFEGGGAKFKCALGRQIPSLRHWFLVRVIKVFFRVYVEFLYGGHEVVLFSRAIIKSH